MRTWLWWKKFLELNINQFALKIKQNPWYSTSPVSPLLRQSFWDVCLTALLKFMTYQRYKADLANKNVTLGSLSLSLLQNMTFRARFFWNCILKERIFLPSQLTSHLITFFYFPVSSKVTLGTAASASASGFPSLPSSSQTWVCSTTVGDAALLLSPQESFILIFSRLSQL